MNIDVLLTPLEISPARVAGRVVVVVDVFRATTCITAAMANGVKRLIPVTTIEEALAMREQLRSTEQVLLGGERRTVKIEGFDLDNSPASYLEPSVVGSTIVMTTTNGTRALNGAVDAGAARVLVGAMVNARAVARAASESGLDITILCAGRADRYTMEDALGAGMIIQALSHDHTVELSDIAYTTLDFYEHHTADLRAALRNCLHYNYIISNGLADDVAYCLRADELAAVGQLDLISGEITALKVATN
ncbi:MAG: 2-phosphosulfolactate phosphatase [Mucinivorans sp.]